MQPNPYKLTSQVSLAPDPQLSSMMEKFKQIGDAVSFSVVFNEVQRRKEVRDAAQSKMMGGPKPQVADQLIQEAKMAQMPAQPQGMGMGMPQGMPPGGGMPPQGGPQGMPQGMPPGGGMPQGMPQGGPPQGLPEQAGIGQLPAPNMQNMAGGGIVSFAGDDDSYVPFDYSGNAERGLEPGIPYRADYSPETEATTNREEDEEDPYPRLDIRDAVGSYSADMDKVLAEQQANYDKYKAERDKFGSAYANAEARDKEMSQQYEDEARTQRGLPWLAAGLGLMGSSERGLGGLSAAGLQGLQVYTAGRDKLAGLKDKQRDFMQTVAEARRAEARGDTDKLYALQQSMAAQKANIASIKANLGLEQDKTRATLEAARLEASGKSASNIPSTDKLKSWYQMQYDAAVEDKDPATAAKWKQKLKEFSDTLNSAEQKEEAALSKYLQDSATARMNAVTRYRQSGNEDALKQLYAPVSSIVSYEDFMATVLGSNIGGGSTSGGGSGGGDPLVIR